MSLHHFCLLRYMKSGANPQNPGLRQNAHMTDDVQNIIITQLRATREDVADIKTRISNIDGTIATVMQHQGHLANQIAQVQVSMDRQAARIGRIEDRLALADAH